MYSIHKKLKVISLMLLGAIHTAKAPYPEYPEHTEYTEYPYWLLQEQWQWQNQNQNLQYIIQQREQWWQREQLLAQNINRQRIMNREEEQRQQWRKGRGKQEAVLEKIIKELFPILIPVITRAIEENKANLGITQCCMILYANNPIYIPEPGLSDDIVIALKTRIMQEYSNLQEQFVTQMIDLPHDHEGWRVTRTDEQGWILPALPASMEMVKHKITTLDEVDARAIVLKYIAEQILLCCLSERYAKHKDFYEAFMIGDTARLKLYLEFQSLHESIDRAGPAVAASKSEQAEMERFFNDHMEKIANDYATYPLDSGHPIAAHLQEWIIDSDSKKIPKQKNYYQIPTDAVMPSVSRKIVCQELQKVAEQYLALTCDMDLQKKNLVYIFPKNDTIYKNLIQEIAVFMNKDLERMRNEQLEFGALRSCIAKILLICVLFNNCYDVNDHDQLPIFMSKKTFKRRRGAHHAVLAADDKDDCASICSEKTYSELGFPRSTTLVPPGMWTPQSESAPSTQPHQQQQFVWVPVMVMPTQY